MQGLKCEAIWGPYQRVVRLWALVDLAGLLHALLPLPLHDTRAVQEGVVVAAVVVLLLPVLLLALTGHCGGPREGRPMRRVKN